MSTTTGMSICFWYKIIYLFNKLPASKFSNNVYFKRTRQKKCFNACFDAKLWHQLINQQKLRANFPLFILHYATSCTFKYTEKEKACLKISSKAKVEPEEITSPFCHCQLWKWGHISEMFFILLWKTTLVYTLQQNSNFFQAARRYSPSPSPSQSPTHLQAESHRERKDQVEISGHGWKVDQ